MLVTSVVQFWSEWGLRISVLASLAAYAVLALLSGARRRSASGWRRLLRWVAVLALWAAYQAVEIAATSALGNLSLCGAGADASSSADEQQLIAFWAPFLLLHLGGPDNLTAYTLEDNMLSLRRVAEMVLQLLGAMYAIWNYIYRGGSWDLLAAAAIVLVAGGARYVERACALWQANLDNMQEKDSISRKKKPRPAGSSSPAEGSSSCANYTEVAVGLMIDRSLGRRELDDGEALLLAQELFPIWRRALVDSSVNPRSSNQRASEKIFVLGWRSMCRVVEMELSLMYEVLYTKAAVAHTWPGYLIRLASPLATAAAASLFWLYIDNNNGPRRIGASFVGITYLLLGAAFAFDVVWLLRALGSTWTYAFLKKKARRRRRRRRQRWPWAYWFYHRALCAGWWRRIHRAVVYLDPMRLLFGVDPVSYRRWSGTIGRYDLLRECTVPRRPWRHWLATKLGLEETRYLSELPHGVKKLLFERVKRILPRTADAAPAPAAYTMADITACWGQETLRRDKKLFKGDELPIAGREFEQDVLAWHIATSIFLSRRMVRKLVPTKPSAAGHVAAIEAMSEYLMFLVAARREMLPGLVLHSLLEETRRALEEIWDEGKGTTAAASAAGAGGGDKERLAGLVRQMRRDYTPLQTDEGRRLILDAAEIAGALTNRSRSEPRVVKMLELIFNVWVDKLLYAGIRCSRESHAKQLSRGGELTTVLWMLVHHAGPFRIGQTKPGYDESDQRKTKPKPEETKPEAPPPKIEDKQAPPVWPPAWYPPFPYPYPWPQPQYGMPKSSPPDYYEPADEMLKPKPEDEAEEAEEDTDEISIPEDEVDPEDAKDYGTSIRYVTLY